MEGARPHKLPFFVRGLVGQEGVAEGVVVLHEPQILVSDPISDDPERERRRLHVGIEALRAEVDEMLAADYLTAERRAPRRAERLPDVRPRQGLGAADGGLDRQRPRRRGRGREGAVGHPGADVAAPPTPTCASGCTISTTSSNRLLRLLAGGDQRHGRELPEDAILVARNIGPGELLDYGRRLRGVVLEEGSVGSHAAIVARALAIPLVIQAARITREAMHGDAILVDGDHGSCTCAPRRRSPRRSARRSTCCTRRRRPMPRCATSRRPPATG